MEAAVLGTTNGADPDVFDCTFGALPGTDVVFVEDVALRTLNDADDTIDANVPAKVVIMMNLSNSPKSKDFATKVTE